MSQTILEIAVFTKDWKKILQLWPEADIKETSLPFPLHYICERVDDNTLLLLYLLNISDEHCYEHFNDFVPYLPFCVMLAEEIDESLRHDLQLYQQRFETPLFLVLPDDEHLKEKIAQISRLEFNLPESVVFERDTDGAKAWKKTLAKIIDKLSKKIDTQNNSENFA